MFHIQLEEKMERKKSRTRKTKNTFINIVLNVFINNPFKTYNFKQVSYSLGIKDNTSKELVKNILLQLRQGNKIIEIDKGKYKLNPKHIKNKIKNTTITGIVDMKQTGKAYIISDELDEDVFISSNNTHHALNGDKVKVHVFPRRKGRKIEGQITKIISRAKKQFVGIVNTSENFAFFVPDSTSNPIDIFIPVNNLNGAKNGDKAIAKITDWPEHSRNPFGKIIDVLGKPGDNDVEMNSILADYDYPLHFTNQVKKEAQNIKNIAPLIEKKKRRDFRNVFTCTIDPEDAKDFDDALSIQKLKNGNWEVGVHIADVSYYVKSNTALDKEAYKRGTSVYLVDRVIPMLPEQLSNLVCSLRPKEEKLCFSAVFEMNNDAKVLNEWFGKTVIKSKRRFNYDEVQKIIEGEDDEYKKQIIMLNNLAKKLREERLKKGSIDFKSEEVKFKLDNNSKPMYVYIKEQKESNKLVEDFMLLANRKVAEKIGKKQSNKKSKTFVYRIHDRPNPEKLKSFADFVEKLGYTIKTDSRKNITKSFNKLFKEIAGKAEENMIETIAVRTMAKAEYSTKNIGHYGLGFKYYSHFTSPIRRYPDLMVHRLLYSYLKDGHSADANEYEKYCKHTSEMERKAIEAERDSIKYKQAEFLLNKLGQEFDGLISGISKWGIFVELTESKCEGMVSLKHLDDDLYYLDEENYCVTGQRYGNEYRLGDKVRVGVKNVNLQKKQIDFELV